MQKTLYVGLDTHKDSISVATAEDGRNGAVQFLGPIPNTPADVDAVDLRDLIPAKFRPQPALSPT